MSNMEPTQICLTIDAEGDSAETPQTTLLGIQRALPHLLDVFSRLGVKATFFVQEDHLCRAASKFRDLWKSLENGGHEIGYHAHGLVRASQEEKEGIITSGLRRMKELGFNPISFRGGRYHLTGSLLSVLEDNGIRYDSSVVPGLRESFPDGTVRCDHRNAPHHPYFLSHEDHCREGGSKILEIPINRYPFLPSKMIGVLRGVESLEEVLFDYFYEIRRDKIIVINVHTFDGLSAVLRDLIRNKQFGYLKKAGVTLLAKVVGARYLTNGSYTNRFESFLSYAIDKGDICFATIRESGRRVVRGDQRSPEEPGAD